MFFPSHNEAFWGERGRFPSCPKNRWREVGIRRWAQLSLWWGGVVRVLHVGWGWQGVNFLPVPMEGTPGFSYEPAQVCNRKGRGSGLESSQLANIYMESGSLLFQWSSYETEKGTSKINQQKYQVLIPIRTWMIVFFLSSASNFYKQNWKHNTCNFYVLLIFFI